MLTIFLTIIIGSFLLSTIILIATFKYKMKFLFTVVLTISFLAVLVAASWIIRNTVLGLELNDALDIPEDDLVISREIHVFEVPEVIETPEVPEVIETPEVSEITDPK